MIHLAHCLTCLTCLTNLVKDYSSKYMTIYVSYTYYVMTYRYFLSRYDVTLKMANFLVLKSYLIYSYNLSNLSMCAQSLQSLQIEHKYHTKYENHKDLLNTTPKRSV